MALKAAATPLVISLVQGSADAFVQGSVLTGLTGNQAYALLGVAKEILNAATLMTAAADFEISMALTRRSKAAMPNISDSDVIWKSVLAFNFTTSGVTELTLTEYWKPDLEIPIVEETIYAQLDSTGTGAVQSAILRMDVEVDTMSPIDRLNLITRSLT
jgi:hypothetical protein